MITPPPTPRAELAAERLRREMRAQLVEARLRIGLPRFAHERARYADEIKALTKALGEVRT